MQHEVVAIRRAKLRNRKLKLSGISCTMEYQSDSAVGGRRNTAIEAGRSIADPDGCWHTESKTARQMHKLAACSAMSSKLLSISCNPSPLRPPGLRRDLYFPAVFRRFFNHATRTKSPRHISNCPHFAFRQVNLRPAS